MKRTAFVLNRNIVGAQYRVHGKIYRIDATGSVVFSHGNVGTGKTLVCHFANPLELVDLFGGDEITVTGAVDYVEDPYGYHANLRMEDCRLAE